MIFASTKGFIDAVPLDKVSEFQEDYLQLLRAQSKETLEGLRSGKLDESITSVLEKYAKEVASKLS